MWVLEIVKMSLLYCHTWVKFALVYSSNRDNFSSEFWRYSCIPFSFLSSPFNCFLISGYLQLTLYTLPLPSPILVLSNFIMISESFFIYWDGNLVSPFNLKTWVLMFSKFLFVIALIISFLFSLFSLYSFLLVRIWSSCFFF